MKEHMSIRTLTILVLALVFTMLTLTACTEVGGFGERLAVTFDSDGGSAVEVIKVAPGDKITAPEAPIKPGADFAGWYLDGKEFDFDVAITENMTLTARWRNFYTVEFYGMDGTLLGSEKVYEGEAAAAPEAPDVKGYEFIGWSLPYDNIQGYTKIVAKYVRLFTVTFLDDDGTELKSEIVREGEAATAPAVTNRLSHDFKGWDKDFDDVRSDLTVTAQYELVTFDVIFKGHDGTELKAETVNRGTAATAPEAPARQDHRFIGWDKAFDAVTEDLVVTAQYELIQHTVTFVGIGGKVLKTEVLTGDGKAATAPEDVDEYGYSFKGWDRAFDNVTSDLTVTAQYEMITYTVTFVDHDGTELKKETVQLGKSAAAPAEPTRTDYRFTGWDKAFDLITEDITVTAQYVQIIYCTIEFVDYDGTVLKSLTIEVGEPITAPDAPTRDGYIFTGWDKVFDKAVEDVDIYAQYIERIGYTMTEIYTEQFAPSASMPIMITSAEELVMLSDYVKAGNALSGYTVLLVTDLDMTGISFASIGSSSKPFSGTFDGQGYRIYNLTISENSDDTGLFGYINGAVIRDTNVEGTVSGINHVGGLAGVSKASEIVRCSFNGTVTSTAAKKNSGQGTGGIVGLQDAGSVKHCVVEAGIYSYKSSNANTGLYTGGVVGKMQGSSVLDNSFFTGTVTSDGSSVGGVVGEASNSASGNITISNCSAVATVTGNECIGGVIGKLYSNSSGRKSYLYNCTAYGTVKGNENVGGVAGMQGVNDATRVNNCFAAAKVEAASTATYVGTLVGLLQSAGNCPVLKSSYLSTVNPGMAAYVFKKGSAGLNKNNVICTEYTDLETAMAALNQAAKSSGWHTWYIEDGKLLSAYKQVYDVTFVDKEGTVLKVEIVAKGTAATAPAEVTIFQGLEFSGWDIAFDNVTADITVTAQYIEASVFTVTFKGQNGEGVLKTEEVNDGLGATAPEAPVVPGYRFDHWSVAFDNITADLEVVAIYVKTWSITFTYEDGSAYEVITLDDGAAITDLPAGPIAPGKVFESWADVPATATADVSIAPVYSARPALPAADITVLQWHLGYNASYHSGWSGKMTTAIESSGADIIVITGLNGTVVTKDVKPASYTAVANPTAFTGTCNGIVIYFKTDKLEAAGDLAIYTVNSKISAGVLPLLDTEGRVIYAGGIYKAASANEDNVNDLFAWLDETLGDGIDSAVLTLHSAAATYDEAVGTWQSIFTRDSANTGYSYTCSAPMDPSKNDTQPSYQREKHAEFVIVYGSGIPAVTLSSAAVEETMSDTATFPSQQSSGNNNPAFFCKVMKYTVNIGATE